MASQVQRLADRVDLGRGLDPALTELADQGLALIETVLEARQGVAPERSELVPGQAAVQAFHLLRWSWTLLFAGGEIPAKVLGRLVSEFILLFWYAELQPDATQRWLDPSRRGSGFARVWGRIGKQAVREDAELALLPILHRTLSQTSHFDPLVFAFTFRWRGQEPDFFPVEPPLDHVSLYRGAEVLLPLESLALGTFVRWIDSDESSWWHREAVSFREAASQWEAPHVVDDRTDDLGGSDDGASATPGVA